MGDSYNGNITALHAVDKGSTPLSPTNKEVKNENIYLTTNRT